MTTLSTEKVDYGTAQQSILSVVFFSDRLHFIIEDIATENLVSSGIEYFSANTFNPSQTTTFEKLLPFVNLPFSKVVVTFFNNEFVQVPTVLYNEEVNEDYLKVNNGLNNFNLSAVNAVKLERFDTALVYNLPQQFLEYLKQVFVNCTVLHSKQVLLSNYLPQGLGNKIYIYFADDSLDVTVFRNGKLFLNNIYKVGSTDDVLYYLFFIAEQMEVNFQEEKLEWNGSLPEFVSSSILAKYLPKTKWEASEEKRFYLVKKASVCA
jgi:hypothetical protein